MQHGGHPPGKALYFPHSPQAGGRVAVEQISATGFVEFLHRVGQDAYVGDREIEPFCAGWRHNMRGVASQKQTAKLHGFHHKAAHAGDALLNHGTFGKTPAGTRQARMQFLPNAFIGPVLNIFVGITLQIKATQLRCSHAQKGKAALVVGIHQLLRRGRRLRKNAEPCEGVNAFVGGQQTLGNARAADSMEAIASGDEITNQFGGLPRSGGIGSRAENCRACAARLLRLRR